MANHENRDLRKNAKPILILSVVLAAVALAAGGITIRQFYLRSRAEREFEQLAEQTRMPDKTAEPTATNGVDAEEGKDDFAASEPGESRYPRPSQLEIPVPDKSVDIAALQADTNEDIYAWIYIPDTQIDYPILQHPDELDYYLDYNLDGTKGYPGCIYTQLMNSKDWTDKNTVIYGHNMKNGTMFANLHFYEDSQFFEEHPYIYIYTQDTLMVYQVFAAYEYYDRHVLLFNDISTDENYQRYLDSIFEFEGLNNNFDTEVELDPADCIITLSTCISNKADRRYLVQAVLMAEEENG